MVDQTSTHDVSALTQIAASQPQSEPDISVMTQKQHETTITEVQQPKVEADSSDSSEEDGRKGDYFTEELRDLLEEVYGDDLVRAEEPRTRQATHIKTLCEFVTEYHKKLQFYSVQDLTSVPEGNQYVAVPRADGTFVIFCLEKLDDLQKEPTPVPDLCELINNSDLEKISFALE